MTARILIPVLAGALACLLTGCTSPAPAPAGSVLPATPPSDSASPALGGDVVVFAASSLTDTFTAIADAFEKENPGVRVTLNFAGSTSLAEGIVSGAPADVFAAANPATMATVSDAGLVAGQSSDFASNSLEIAVPKGNPAGIRGLADFADPARTIALCAPQVPCGAAADTAFRAAGIVPSPDTLEEDVKAVLVKVRLDEVDAGLVYRTDIIAAGGAVDGIEFDGADDAPNHYPIARLTASRNADAAAAFVAFVAGGTGQSLLAAAGFGRP